MISIICCFNNYKTYNEMLYKSVSKQKAEYEIIAIDNSKGKFESSAQALNYGASISKGEYLVFVHQDMEFMQEDFLQSLKRYLDELNDSIIGLAGMKDALGVYTNLKHGSNKKYAGDFRVNEPIEMQTLDECLIAMKRDTYLKLKFDEVTCYNWHLYAVDMCLAGNLINVKSYVIPLEAYHKSCGVISREYKKNLYKIIKKYRKSYDVIYTTCSVSYTNIIKNIYYKIKKKSLNFLCRINER